MLEKCVHAYSTCPPPWPSMLFHSCRVMHFLTYSPCCNLFLQTLISKKVIILKQISDTFNLVCCCRCTPCKLFWERSIFWIPVAGNRRGQPAGIVQGRRSHVAKKRIGFATSWSELPTKNFSNSCSNQIWYLWEKKQEIQRDLQPAGKNLISFVTRMAGVQRAVLNL